MKKLLILTFILTLVSLAVTIVTAYYYRDELTTAFNTYRTLSIDDYYPYPLVERTISWPGQEQILAFDLVDTDLEFVLDERLSQEIKIKAQNVNYLFSPESNDQRILISTTTHAPVSFDWSAPHINFSFNLPPFRPLANEQRSLLKVSIPADLADLRVELKTRGDNEVEGELVATKFKVMADWGELDLSDLKLNTATLDELDLNLSGKVELPSRLEANIIKVTLQESHVSPALIRSLTARRKLTLTNASFNDQFTVNQLFAGETLTLNNLAGTLIIPAASASAIEITNEAGTVELANTQSVFTLTNEDSGIIKLQNVHFLPGSQIIRDESGGIHITASEGKLTGTPGE